MRRRGTIAAAALVACLVFAAAALAGEITVTPGVDRFSSSTFTIAQGEATTFRNNDVAVSHDVTSDGTEGDTPLFESGNVAAGSSAPVRGTEFLVTGNYPFRCTLHPGMTATLVVSSAGTPKPKPGTPGDTTPASGRVAIADRTVSAVRKRRALKVRATTSEAARFVFTAKSGPKTIARGSASVTDPKTVSLKLTAAGRRLVARARRLKVKVTATITDTAGNKSSASATRTLR